MKQLSNLFPLLVIFCLLPWTAAAQDVNSAKPNIAGPSGVRVNSYTGNLFLQRQDLYLPGRGLSVDISFSYNSGMRQKNDGFGPGWTMNYNMSYLVDSTGDVVLERMDGRTDVYKAVAGRFIAPDGVLDSLERYDGAKLRLRERDGLTYYFDDEVHRKLTRIVDRNGNAIGLTYAGTLLNDITDPSGRIFEFQWDQGRLRQITLDVTPARTVQYQYDALGNLTKALNPLGGAKEYRYDESSKMVAFIDEDGNAVTMSYNDLTAVSKIVSCVGTQTISYDYQGRKTHVTERISGELQLTTYEFDAEGRLAKQYGNCCGYSQEFKYDKDLNVIKLLDANGNKTLYSYDSRGNVTQEVNALQDFQTYSYESQFFQMTSKADFNGNTTTYEYDANGNMTGIHHPLNIDETYGYDAFGNNTSFTDGNGHATQYGYDVHGYRSVITDANNGQVLRSYDEMGNKISETDQNGHTTTYAYDLLNRLTQMTDALGYSETYTYDGRGNKTSIVDKSGNTTTFQYDGLSRQVAKIDALGFRTENGYDARGNMIRFVDSNGNKTKFEYNQLNRLAAMTTATGELFQYEYDANGNLTRLVLPNNNTLTAQYDALNRLLQIGDNQGTIKQLVYDKNSNQVSVSDAGGNVYQYRFDALNRVIELKDPYDKEQKLSYDKNGNVISLMDQNDHQFFFQFDNLNRLVSNKNALNNNALYEYDAAGNRIKITDRNGNETSFYYTELNQLAKEIYADGSKMEYSYTKTSQVLKRTDNLQVETIFEYDKLLRLVKRSYSTGWVENFTYDKVGNLLSAQNPNALVEFGYDGVLRKKSESINGIQTLFTYDIPNSVRTIQYPSGKLITEHFDGRNLLNSIVSSEATSGNLVEFDHNANGQITRQAYLNGTYSTGYYDNKSQLKELKHFLTGINYHLLLEYDASGNKIKELDKTDIDRSSLFEYDAIDQLVRVKKGVLIGNDIQSPIQDVNLSYDAMGNRSAVQQNNLLSSYTVNSLNQYTSVASPVAINYQYNENGNLLGDGIFSFAYDAENRLTAVNNGMVANYRYDALGRRIQKIIGTDTTFYLYNSLKIIETRGNAGVLKASYIYGTGLDEILAMQRNGAFYFYHSNTLGSVTHISDSNGTLQERYEYDAFGRPTIFDALDQPISSSTIGNFFLYTGREYDAETGYYFYRNRSFSSDLGRFLQRDPLGYFDGLNLYSYVHNNPANFTDPLGLFEFHSFSEFSWYGNFGGPNWTNGTFKWSESDDFPRDPSQEGYVDPKDDRDRCYFGHDTCLHDCTSICDPSSRQSCRRGCDRTLAKCLRQLPDSFTRDWQLGRFGRWVETKVFEFSPNNNPGKYREK